MDLHIFLYIFDGIHFYFRVLRSKVIMFQRIPIKQIKKVPTRDVYYVVLNYLLNDIPQCGDIFIS